MTNKYFIKIVHNSSYDGPMWEKIPDELHGLKSHGQMTYYNGEISGKKRLAEILDTLCDLKLSCFEIKNLSKI